MRTVTNTTANTSGKARRKRRLQTVFFILLGTGGATSLLLTAIGSNMNHYYELSAIAAGEAPLDKIIRIGGIVAEHSIERTPETLKVRFVVTDLQRRINVDYQGVLPDLFREKQGVLAKGKLLDKQHFIAEEILAKHDENYLPTEVRDELEKNGYLNHYGEEQ